ncbi:uncharacterized protein LOC121406166 [Lytechinus variegatus]|uniref:uncharacterized protein LOC121406166 n=1 Tax=Lytechinus variegatus TaxID=7654 RepID=UPI001BB1D016|nr:uncharacterized protein LOC121406166 [Lytechinus variegatus]
MVLLSGRRPRGSAGVCGVVVLLIFVELSINVENARSESISGFEGLDLLEVFKSGNFTKGITQEQGPLPHSNIWRLRPKTNLITIPPHQIAPLRNQLMRSHAFSVYFLARQLEQTSGMLFSISSLEGRVLFTLTSSSRTGEMRIRYRTRESESLLQTVLPTPLIDSARFAHTLLIVDGDHLTLFTECKSSVDVTLEGVVNFDLRDDATVTIGQGPLGRNKFNVSMIVLLGLSFLVLLV